MCLEGWIPKLFVQKLQFSITVKLCYDLHKKMGETFIEIITHHYFFLNVRLLDTRSQNIECLDAFNVVREVALSAILGVFLCVKFLVHFASTVSGTPRVIIHALTFPYPNDNVPALALRLIQFSQCQYRPTG